MTFVDKQNRLAIMENIREITNLDFQKEVRIFLKTVAYRNYLLLSNSQDLDLPCFGIVHFDAKHRFHIPKELRDYLSIDHETKLLIYCLKGDLIIEKL